jgi:hypothetical protein
VSCGDPLRDGEFFGNGELLSGLRLPALQSICTYVSQVCLSFCLMGPTTLCG